MAYVINSSSAFEHGLNISNVMDIGEWIAIDNQDIRKFPGF